MNISGVLVYAAREKAATVTEHLSSIAGVEVHANQDGKLVVTVEDDNLGALADRVIQFQDIDGVLSAAVVYHHNEDLEEQQNQSHQIMQEPTPCGCEATNVQEAIK